MTKTRTRQGTVALKKATEPKSTNSKQDQPIKHTNFDLEQLDFINIEAGNQKSPD